MAQIFNDKHLQKLLSKERLEMLKIKEVLEISEISKSRKLLDIGAGPGVFTIPAAKCIAGDVTAVDTSSKMVEYLGNRLVEEGVTNVNVIEGTLETVNEESFDRILIVHLIHEVPDPASFANQVAQRMVKDGLITVLDWKKIDTKAGPSIEHRLSEDEVVEFFGSDFEELHRVDWGPMFYLLVLRKIK